MSLITLPEINDGKVVKNKSKHVSTIVRYHSPNTLRFIFFLSGYGVCFKLMKKLFVKSIEIWNRAKPKYHKITALSGSEANMCTDCTFDNLVVFGLKIGMI